jgi:hypothetical protein
MSIHFLCPLGHKLQVPDERAGKKGRCPVCRQHLIVPQIAATTTSVTAEPDEDGGTDLTHYLVEAAHAQSEMNKDPSPVVAGIGAETIAAGADSAIETNLPARPPPVSSGPLTTLLATPPPLPGAEQPVAVEQSSPPPSIPISQKTVRWLTWQRSAALSSYQIVRPNSRQLEIVYWLASLLPFAVAFCAAPALPHLQFSGAPLWAQAMLCGGMVQLGYAAWLAMVPDFSTVRVGLYLFAASAATYFIALAVTCFLAESQVSTLGMSGMRAMAAAWCVLALVISSLASTACGWVLRHWST